MWKIYKDLLVGENKNMSIKYGRAGQSLWRDIHSDTKEEFYGDVLQWLIMILMKTIITDEDGTKIAKCPCHYSVRTEHVCIVLLSNTRWAQLQG